MPKHPLAACLAILLLVLSASVSAEPIKPTEQWGGFYPVKQLGKLPAKQQKSAVGAIQDKKTWEAVFKVLQPDMKLPEVDFKKNMVVFARNIRFVNRIIGLTAMVEEETLRRRGVHIAHRLILSDDLTHRHKGRGRAEERPYLRHVHTRGYCQVCTRWKQ